MEKATKIFEKHWTKATGKPLDETSKNHMKYAIEAVNEALCRRSVFGLFIPDTEDVLARIILCQPHVNGPFTLIRFKTNEADGHRDGDIIFKNKKNCNLFLEYIIRAQQQNPDGYYFQVQYTDKDGVTSAYTILEPQPAQRLRNDKIAEAACKVIDVLKTLEPLFNKQ